MGRKLRLSTHNYIGRMKKGGRQTQGRELSLWQCHLTGTLGMTRKDEQTRTEGTNHATIYCATVCAGTNCC